MANTTTTSDNIVNITGLDADWAVASLPAHLKNKHLRSIQFNPSAAGDILIVRCGSGTGAIAFKVKVTGDTDQRIKYFGQHPGINPSITISECTLGTAANALVIMEFE